MNTNMSQTQTQSEEQKQIKLLKGKVLSKNINAAGSWMGVKVLDESNTEQFIVFFKDTIGTYRDRIFEGSRISVVTDYIKEEYQGKTQFKYTMKDDAILTIDNKKDDLDLEQQEGQHYQETGPNYTKPSSNVSGPTSVNPSNFNTNTNPEPKPIDGSQIVPKELLVRIALSKNYQKVECEMTVDISESKEDYKTVFNTIYYNMYEEVRKKIETAAHDMR